MAFLGAHELAVFSLMIESYLFKVHKYDRWSVNLLNILFFQLRTFFFTDATKLLLFSFMGWSLHIPHICTLLLHNLCRFYAPYVIAEEDHSHCASGWNDA